MSLQKFLVRRHFYCAKKCGGIIWRAFYFGAEEDIFVVVYEKKECLFS